MNKWIWNTITKPHTFIALAQTNSEFIPTQFNLFRTLKNFSMKIASLEQYTESYLRWEREIICRKRSTRSNIVALKIYAIVINLLHRYRFHCFNDGVFAINYGIISKLCTSQQLQRSYFAYSLKTNVRDAFIGTVVFIWGLVNVMVSQILLFMTLVLNCCWCCCCRFDMHSIWWW